MILLMLLAFAETTLESRLRPLIESHQGKVAVAIKHLGTGETFYHQADQVMPTASLIKLPVLIEAYLQADEGKLSLREEVTLRESEMVPGSGLLTYHFSDGARFSLRDACRLMIAFSDNTATNLVIDRVGIVAVNQRMTAWGLKETRLNAKVFRGSTTSVDKVRTAKYGLGSTTAREMAALWEQLIVGDKLRPALSRAILGHLKHNDDKDKFKRLLPAEVALAHKDGAVSAARTDAGVLFTPNAAMIVVVLTNDNTDRRWVQNNAGNVLCAKIARAVYDHYHPSTK